MNCYVIYENGKRRNIVSDLAYVLRANQNWRVYVESVNLKMLPERECEVTYRLSDKRIVRSIWSDYIVAYDYFTKRTRSLAGVDLTVN
jgi:hypothetical protein